MDSQEGLQGPFVSVTAYSQEQFVVVVFGDRTVVFVLVLVVQREIPELAADRKVKLEIAADQKWRFDFAVDRKWRLGIEVEVGVDRKSTPKFVDRTFQTEIVVG